MVIVLYYVIYVCKYIDIETKIFDLGIGFILREKTLLDIEYQNVALLVALYSSTLKSW